MLNRYIYKNSQLANAFVILFFCITLVPYTQSFIPIAIAQLVLFSIIYGTFICYAHNAPLLHVKSLDGKLYWFFIFLYIPLLGIRLYVDFILKNIDFFVYGSGYTIIFFYIAEIVLPAFILHRYRVHISTKYISKYLIGILLVCMLLSIHKIINGDVEISNDGRFDNGYGIFSIEFGHYAVSLILLCITQLKTTVNNWAKPLFIIPIAIGFFAAMLAGSRGPIIALILCLVVYYLSNTNNSSKLIKYLFIFVLICPFIIYWAEEISDLFTSMGIRSVDRIYNSFLGDGSLANQTSGRDILYNDALFYFGESPIVGYSYLIPGKIYCHNIILEQFMALGIFGGSIFLIINVIALKHSWHILRYNREYAIIPLLYIQYFIFGCFSSTSIDLPQYWLFMLLTMNYSALSQNLRFHLTNHKLPDRFQNYEQFNICNHPDLS